VKDSTVNYLLDAGPLVGLLDADDQWHAWSHQTLTVLEERMATTETVIAEACHLLRKLRPAILEITRLLAERRLLLVPVLAERPERVGQLLERYPQMDAGDATLVVLSEIFPRARIITLDTRDFRYYRRFRNQALPLLAPPD
jgi:hypothetical protein